MSPSGNQKRKKKEAKQKAVVGQRNPHKNQTPNFDCTTVNHARKLPRKPMDLLLVDDVQ